MDGRRRPGLGACAGPAQSAPMAIAWIPDNARQSPLWAALQSQMASGETLLAAATLDLGSDQRFGGGLLA